MNVVAAPNMKTALGTCALLACAVALVAAPARAQGRRDAASGFAEVNGTRLWYETAGKGSTVVLVHGGLVDSRLWDDQMKELAKRHRVVRYDLRGYGKSAAPTADFSPVEDLRALLAFLKVERATVVGLSLGGIIAADFALEHPRMTEGLVLVGAGLRGDKQPPDPKSMEAYRASVREGAGKFAELALETPLFAGVKEKPRAHARLREMLLRQRARAATPLRQSAEVPRAGDHRPPRRYPRAHARRRRRPRRPQPAQHRRHPARQNPRRAEKHYPQRQPPPARRDAAGVQPRPPRLPAQAAKLNRRRAARAHYRKEKRA